MGNSDRYNGPWTEAEAAHLMRRAGFGGKPEEIQRLAQMGMERAVSYLVDYDPVDQVLERQINSLRELKGLREIKQPEDFDHLQAWWLYRMVNTRQPLQEQFTLFLHDHFVSEWGKVRNGVRGAVDDGNDGSRPEEQRCTSGTLPPDKNRREKITARLMQQQNQLLRQNGHAPFRDTLLKITRDPAMLLYLDNHNNFKERPQENYARELMELFSMGVGNFSEEDVRQVAKALTGESLKTGCELDYPYSHFFFSPEHSLEEKIVFGVPFNHRRRGQDTEQVIDLILKQVSRSGISPAHDRLPAAALHMIWKFITWFVWEEFPIEHPAVEAFAQRFYTQKPNGDIYDVREALRTLFQSNLFYDEQYRFQMIKHPVDFIVTALRSLDLGEVDYLEAAHDDLADMGMELFNPPNVAGWNHGRTWINATNLINRFGYADRLSRRTILTRKFAQKLLDEKHIQNEDDHEGMIEYFRARLLQQPLSDAEHIVFTRFLPRIRGENALMRKLSGTAHLMMTMPKYQVK